MEEFPKENTEQGGENNLSPEMQELADMAGKMGENTEVEQAEQKTRYAEIDNEIFNGIRSIEDEADRDLATAILSVYYDKHMGKEDGTRSKRDLAKMQGMKVIVDYMNGDKTEPLEEPLYKAYREVRDQNIDLGIETKTASNIADSVDKIFGWHRHHGGLWSTLRIGQRIDNYDSLDKWGPYVWFEVPGREYGVRFALHGGRVEQSERAVTGVLAENIIARLKEPKKDWARDVNIAELDMLARAYNMAANDLMGNNGLERHIDFEKREAEGEMRRRMSFAMRENNDPRREEIVLKVPGKGGVAEYAAGGKLLRDFHDYQRMHKSYLKHLEAGKMILAGQNWRELKRPDDQETEKIDPDDGL